MANSNIEKLTKAKAAVELLEQSIATELAALPSAYGYVTMEEFVIAIKAAGRTKRRGASRPEKAIKTRKRAKITDATRAKVKRLFRAGKTGSQIANALKISLPSVQNIKKALGLTKSSKKPARKAKTRRAPAKRVAVPKARKRRVSPKKATAPEAKPAAAPTEAIPAPSA